MMLQSVSKSMSLYMKNQVNRSKRQVHPTLCFLEPPETIMDSKKWNPESHMYGRDYELSTLGSAYNRTIARYATGGKSEIVLVSGTSGTGKTFFVREGMKDIMCSSSGFYASGKCKEVERNHPYACVVDLLTSLCVSVVEAEKEMPSCKIRAGIKRSLDSDDCNMLTDLIPKIGDILEWKPDMESSQPELDLSGKELHSCLLRAMRRFVRSIATWGTVVLFLDDLQWIDESSLELIQLLVLDDNLKGFLFISAYRDNEVGPGHMILDSFEKFEAESVTTTRISLGLLQKEHVIHIVADMLRTSYTKAEPLGDFVHKHTGGHALFVVRLLEYLRHKEFLCLPPNSSSWEWDLDTISSNGAVPDTLEGILADEIVRMPENTRDFLKTAAAIGILFDDFTTDLILSSLEEDNCDRSKRRQEAMKESLKCSVELGFIRNVGNGSHQFNHDKMWQASYNMIPEKERERIHLLIGRRLLHTMRSSNDKTERKRTSKKHRHSSSQGDSELQDRQLFVTVDHLNRGKDLIADSAERDELIMLNQIAANLALKSSSFHPAMRYLKSGINLLSEDHWTSQYDLSLQLFSTLAKVASSIGNYNMMNDCVDRVLVNGKSVLDKFEAYYVQIQSLTIRKHPDKAIGRSLEVLEQLGFTEKWTKSDVRVVTFQIKRALKGHTKESILNIPELTDERRLKAMKILEEMIPLTYGFKPDLFTLICCKIARWSLKYGICEGSIRSFGGLAQLNLIPNRDKELAQTSLALLERFDAIRQKPALYMLIYGYIQHRTSLLKDCLEPLSKGFKLGTQLGISEHAGYNCSLLCSYSYFSGERLGLVESKMNSFLAWMDEYKFSDNTRKCLLPLLQVVQCLRGRNVPVKHILNGSFVNLKEFLAQAEENKNLKCTLDLYRLELFYLYHQYEEAGSVLEGSIDITKFRPGHFSGVRFTFYECLASIQLAKIHKSKSWSSRVNSSRSKIRKWVKSGNVNCVHMASLVDAEVACSEGKYDDAMGAFQQMIQDADSIKFLQDKALIFERAGLCFSAAGRDNTSKNCFSRAELLYSEWGANAKKDHVRQLNSGFSRIQV